MYINVKQNQAQNKTSLPSIMLCNVNEFIYMLRDKSVLDNQGYFGKIRQNKNSFSKVFIRRLP